MDKVNTVNDDPRFQSYMSAEEDDRKLMNSYNHKYYDEGVEYGINQGVEQGKETTRKEMIQLLHNNGLSVLEISKYLEVSEDEIKKYICD